MKKLLFCLIFIGMWGSNVGLAQTLQETFKYTFRLQPGSRLIVENTNGNVRIEGWDRSEVYVEATKKAQGSKRQDIMRGFENLRIQVRHEKKDLVITTIYPPRSFSLWNFLQGKHYRLRVDYYIKVPRVMKVHVQTTNGNVTASGVSGNVLLRSMNGNIQLYNCTGLVKMRTTNGNIAIQLNQLKAGGEYEGKTTNGNILVQLPEEAQFEIHAHTTNGTVSNSFKIWPQCKYRMSHLDGTVGKPEAVFLLSTTNGNIRVYPIALQNAHLF